MTAATSQLYDTVALAPALSLPVLERRPAHVPGVAASITARMTHYIYHRSFSEPDAERILTRRCQVSHTVYTDGTRGTPGTSRTAALTAEEEGMLFLQYNYARWRLRQLVDDLGVHADTAVETRRWLERARQIQEVLAGANLGLVYALAQRNRFPRLAFDDLISEGSLALLRSIDRFDFNRGIRFSTYAGRAILTSFLHCARRDRRQTPLITVQLNTSMDFEDPGTADHECRWKDSLAMLEHVLRVNKATLTPLEQTVLAERFGMNRQKQCQTLQAVGRGVSLSDERVRQVQKQALAKLRTLLCEAKAVANTRRRSAIPNAARVRGKPRQGDWLRLRRASRRHATPFEST